MLSKPNWNGSCCNSKRPGKSISEVEFSVMNRLYNFILKKKLLTSHAGLPHWCEDSHYRCIHMKCAFVAEGKSSVLSCFTCWMKFSLDATLLTLFSSERACSNWTLWALKFSLLWWSLQMVLCKILWLTPLGIKQMLLCSTICSPTGDWQELLSPWQMQPFITK